MSIPNVEGDQNWNELCFEWTYSIPFENSSFTISEFRSGSSSYSKDLYPGSRIEFEDYDQDSAWLSFNCDRVSSAEVAKWFSSKFDESENTLNHNPDTLHFAFIGSLRLRYLDNDLVFENVGIARGRIRNRNDWWFAVSSGRNIHGCGVEATDASGRHRITFFRSGNAANVIALMPDAAWS